MKILVSLLLTALVALGAPAPAQAQAQQRIAAVVNDELISIYDLVARMRLVALTSRIPLNAETQSRLAPQVLRGLVDEALQLQEAERLGIRVQDVEIARAISSIESGNGMTPGTLTPTLTRAGVPLITLRRQIRARIAWDKIQLRLARNIDIGEGEIDDALARARDALDQPQRLVGEIFLGVDSPEREEAVRLEAEKLVEQIRSGANFNALARQFSESATAAVGGDLGWVGTGELAGELEDVLTQMSPGEVSVPVRGLSGYYILVLRDRRDGAREVQRRTVFDLRQAYLAEGRDPAAWIAQLRTAADCDAFGAVAGPGPYNGRIGAIAAAEFIPPLAAAVAALEKGAMTAALPVEGGSVVLYACDKRQEVVGGPLPSRNELRETLLRQRVEVQARRRLRDLRRTAFIDIRA